MIRPIRGYSLQDVVTRLGERERPFPMLDRAFDAVERALARLGVEDPASLRTPRPVEEALSDTALPEGTLLILNPSELRAAELDIEETVKDERLGGTLFLSMPPHAELPGRARGLRELATASTAFAFHDGPRPSVPSRLGKMNLVPLPPSLRNHRFVVADTPGFRVLVATRSLPGGGFIGLWSGNEHMLDEVRGLLGSCAQAAGYDVPRASSNVPALDGVDSESDVWDLAKELREYRVVREAELREIARAAALRGVALRREREAKRVAQERQAATGS
jgi:hypothetical protein